jgi:hypothetical protein
MISLIVDRPRGGARPVPDLGVHAIRPDSVTFLGGGPGVDMV